MRAVNICATLFCLVLLISERDGSPDDVLAPLKSKCFDTSHVPGWWSYIWCFRDSVEQLHYDSSRDVIEANKLIGNYIGEESQSQKEVYRRKIADCQSAPGTYVPRRADVTISCCRDEKWSAMHDRFRENSVFGTFIESVTEPSPCVYMLRVCSDLICSTISNPRVLAETTSRLLKTRGCDKSLDDEDERDDTSAPSQHGFVDFIVDQIDYISDKGSIKGDAYLSEASQLLQLDRVRNIFIHGYDMYMEHAQPQARYALCPMFESLESL